MMECTEEESLTLIEKGMENKDMRCKSLSWGHKECVEHGAQAVVLGHGHGHLRER